MSKPRPVSVDELSLDELRGLVGELLTRLSEVEAENAALKEEIGRLKGHKGRPKLKPSGMAQAADQGKRKAGGRKRKRAKRQSPRVQEEQKLAVNVPVGSRFKMLWGRWRDRGTLVA